MQPLRSILGLIISIQTIIIVQLFAASKSNPSKAEQQSQYANVVPNVIVVKFSGDYQITEYTINTKNLSLNDRLRNSDFYALKSIFSQNITGLKKSLSSDFSKIYLAYFQGDKNPLEMAKLVSSWPGIVYAEPKFIHYLLEEEFPNDTLFSTQSGYYDVIEAPQAWDIVKGEQGETIIAIVDGGTDIDHIDLSDNIWQNQAEVDGITGVDDDENGYVDDLYGWNFANQSGDPTGLPETPFNADHGTHTTGIASAVTDNITGVAGTSWNATVMGINASHELSDKFIKYGYEGIIYAAENGADIISCSWGGSSFSYFEQDVVNYATSLGAIVIAAAGNDNSDISFYPAAYANVLSIAGTIGDERYWDSNYGPDIDLAAPAVNIFSTFNNDTYGFSTGTSMSAPMVAAVAGLVRIQHPEWIGLQLGEQVRVTADSLPAVTVPIGRGRLNAYRAVTETSPSIRLIDYRIEDENGNGTIEPGERVEIFITIQNYLEPVTDVNLILTSTDPFVTISQSEIYVSSISSMDTIQTGAPFVCEIAENAPNAHTIKFLLEIITNEYRDVDYLSLNVLPGYLNLTINNIKMTVTNFGRIVNSELFEAEDTVGFSYKYMGNLLYEGAIISGTGETQISDAARAQAGTYNEDFVVTPEGEITSKIPGILSDEESFGQFIDLEAVNPMNIRISQYTYAWHDSVNDDYIIMLFGIQNLNPDDLNNFHFGIFFDWDIDGETYNTNIIQYNAELNMGFAYDAADGPETHVGVVSLSDEEMNFKAIYNDDLGDFTSAKKWESISGGITYEEAGPADVSFVIANGPLSIPAHSTHRLAFAMVAADDSIGLFEHADSAIAMWEKLIILDVEQEDQKQLPFSYGLSQNYPNPFNPKTIINYELRITNNVELSVYNILGQKVATLVSGKQSAGLHQAEWDAREFSSGVYYYHLRAGDFREVKKMILMK